MDERSQANEQLHGWVRRLSRRPVAYLIIISAAMLMFLPNLGQHGLWDIDEAHNAECAREMYEAQTLIVPTFNYQLRTDKPVMLYWCIQCCYWFFGISEWSSRLPSVLAGMGSLLVCYEIARRLFSSVTGLLASLILCSSFMFSVSSHAVTPDAILILTVQLTFLTWLMAYERKQPAWLLLSGVFAGLAMLTKGPVGIALPGLVTVLFLLWQRDLRFLCQRRSIQSILLCLLVALPWYILVAMETHGEFLRGFFLTHNLNRFNSPMEGHRGPVVYHIIVILAAFAPWSIFLGPTFWFQCRQQYDPDSPTKPWATRFLLCWIAVWFIVFSLAATKLPNYVLPTYPPLAMLTAAFLVRWWKHSTVAHSLSVPSWVWRLSLACFALIGIVLLVAIPLLAGWIPLTPLRGRTLPETAWLLPVALVPLLCGWLCWKHWSRNHIGWGVAVVLLGSLTLTASLGAWGPVVADQERASKPLATMIREAMGNDDVRIGTHPGFYRPSMVFYLQREIVRCTSEKQALDMLKTRIPTFMLVPSRHWDTMAAQLGGQYTVLQQRHDFTAGQDILLISNQGPEKASMAPVPSQ